MSPIWLEFERPIIELERKIEELHIITGEDNLQTKEKLTELKTELTKLKEDTYSNLTPWQRVQLARHPDRPYTSDYIKLIFDDFLELHGDRHFRDDPAIITGIGKINGKSVVLIGSEKGRKTKDRIYHNFGMAHPEGYRKALRVMKLGEKFNKPIIIFIDTSAAYPGIGAEERGQAQAIAENIKAMSTLKVPILIMITGEGGSGGALGIGVGDVVLVQEYAFYSVIPPEACAAILWKDASRAPEAAKSLKLTSKKLLEFKVIDGIIEEPDGGTHRDFKKAATILKETILKHLNYLSDIPTNVLVEKRIEKFANMGIYKKIKS